MSIENAEKHMADASGLAGAVPRNRENAVSPVTLFPASLSRFPRIPFFPGVCEAVMAPGRSFPGPASSSPDSARMPPDFFDVSATQRLLPCP